MKVICNSSTLIALHNINRLDILKTLFKTIIIPEEVCQEVFSNNRMKFTFIQRKAIHNLLAFDILNETVGKGESACIVLYKEISADLLIMDDAKARKIAGNHGINLTGLIGVLRMAKDENIIDSYEAILKQLKEINFRISKKLIDNLLLDT